MYYRRESEVNGGHLLYVIVVSSVLFGVITTCSAILPYAYGQKAIDNNGNTTRNQISSPSIAISTDKSRYMIDERVTIFGTTANNRLSNQIPQKVTLVVTYIGGSSKAYPWFLPWHDNSKTTMIYNASLYTYNNSFLAKISNIPVSGRYNVSATLAGAGGSSITTFDVENPFFTTFAIAFYFGTAILALFLSVIVIGTSNVGIIQIFNFIFLSGYVVSILVSLAFSDVALGPNSPIGLVLKRSASGESTWVINVGGSQETNYTNGLQIPIYVIVFGVLGGYLRYLYDTATTATKNLEKESEIIDHYINKLTSQRLKDVDITTTDLDKRFRRGYVKKIEKLIQEDEQKKKEQDARPDSLEAQKYVLRFRLNRRYHLFQSLKNLALLLLAPLLATAIWFLLLQAGFEGQQDTMRGQTGVFILAAISFAIGLVINEAIERLIKFAKDTLGGGKRDDSKLTPLEERLKKIKKLKDDSFITQEDHDEKKKEILGEI
jgi:hypothetical protein